MSVAQQPGRLQTGEKLSWLRQAGFLCSFVLCLSGLGVLHVHASDVRPCPVVINGQDEPCSMRIAPDVPIPNATKNECDIRADLNPGFDLLAAPGRDRVFPVLMSPIHSERTLHPDLPRHCGFNVIVEHERGGLPVILYIQVEDSRSRVVGATAGQVGAIDSTAGLFRASPQSLSGSPQREGEHGDEYCGDGCENSLVVVKEVAFAVNDGKRLPSGETPEEFWTRFIGFSCWFGFLLFLGTLFIRGR
jgi:hypothetical protein